MPTSLTSLRTRIARTAWISHRDRQLEQLGMKPSEYAADIPIPDWAYAIADAVIHELGRHSAIHIDRCYISGCGCGLPKNKTGKGQR